MLSRREVLGVGLVGTTTTTAARVPLLDDHTTERIVQALDRIEREIRRSRTNCDLPLCPEVETVRAQQRTFLRGHQKFPDFIEVGIAVWERIYDWHVRTWQPLDVTRQPGGRYTMALGVTTLVLRPDVEEGFVGFPYDGSAV